jgi:hypothetical protein
MATTRKASTKSAKATAKKVAAKKVAAKPLDGGPPVGWATPLGSMTLNDLIQVGLIDSETSKLVPPAGLRVILAESDIQKIVNELVAALKPI